MKKLLSIIVLSLLWCNVGLTKDLTGKKLLCDGFVENTKIGIEFFSSSGGSYYEIRNEISWMLLEFDFNYVVKTDYINMVTNSVVISKKGYRTAGINLPSLNRKTLKLGKKVQSQCELVDFKPGHLRLFMESLLNDLKNQSDEKNKI